MTRAWQTLSRGLSAIVGWRFFKPAVFVASLVPGALVAYDLAQVLIWNHPDALGVDPTKTLLHETGQDTLALLLVTLSITPIRRLFKVNRIQTVRRMLGVTSFFYALAHLSTYLVFDQLCYSYATCDVHGTWEDILKRKFIFAGLTSLSIMLALAVTSTSGWVRRLKKWWGTLHRLVYVAAVSAIVHFIWIQKSDIRQPLRWGAWLAVLLAVRVYLTWQKRATSRTARVAVARGGPAAGGIGV
jgi:sulfoxide reductase heme-binding subunit YedZ